METNDYTIIRNNLLRSPAVIHIFPINIFSVEMQQKESFFRKALWFVSPPAPGNRPGSDEVNLVLNVNILKEMEVIKGI
jgi:hypothetical protein